MPNKEVDMVSPLVLEEHLNDVADDFYFDLPMEDLEGNQLTEDWDASLQHLELPTDDLIGGLSTPFTVKIFDDNSFSRTSSSKVELKPRLKNSSEGSTETEAHRKIYHQVACEGGKDPSLFQNSSSVSVLESSNKLLLGYKFFIPVKRARSKRLRPPTLNPRLTIPFISSSKRRKIRKRNPPPPDGSETDEAQLQPSSPGVARKCTHCEVTKTPQWREGPMGPKTLCNACGVRYRSGRLLPEYRPAASPTFVASVHSNLHRKVVEMRNKGGSGEAPHRATTAAV